MSRHFWQGNWIDDKKLSHEIENMSESLLPILQTKRHIEELYRSADRFSKRLIQDIKLRKKLIDSLVSSREANAVDGELVLNEISEQLAERYLRKKVKAEFGIENPLRWHRISKSEPIFEAWSSLGILVHIVASNSPSLAVLSAFEGLLTGNINFIKLPSAAGDFTGLVFEEFFCDSFGKAFEKFVIIAKISSSQKELLKKVLHQADVVAAWGGEEAISSIKQMCPDRARLIEWGHRISFGYFSKSQALQESEILKFAEDVFRFDQQACSSPQCVFIEDASFAELMIFGEVLSKKFKELEDHYSACDLHDPSDLEAAELTRVVEVTKEESCLAENFTKVIEGPSKKWRILIDSRSGLRASPLYRTIWVKAVRKNEILSSLRPLSQYLQTVGLSCKRQELSELIDTFFKAGATRVRPMGKMLDSYPGEPHDGVSALTRYMKKISVHQECGLDTFASLDDLSKRQIDFVEWPAKTMNKTDFQNLEVNTEDSELFFKSGGSSGDSKISIFSYEDYHWQMRLAADGLLAAGLNPKSDRCMNLFFGGGLYGGFVSFFTIFEDLEAVQFPMAAHSDFEFVGKTIVHHKVNTLLGMPSYLLQLFSANEDLFRKSKLIEKIYFGGEHFSESQRQRLKADFGVKIIRSASYGSVDMGPLGYQCVSSAPGVHHLHQDLHHLEILSLESDLPAKENETGRLVFSTHGRRGMQLLRYDIGDLGRWVAGDCACGRRSPRFELMGRHGDIFRAAGMFLNFNKILKILMDTFNYSFEAQLALEKSDNFDRATLYLDQNSPTEIPLVKEEILNQYSDLHEVAVQEGSLNFEVKKIKSAEMVHAVGSGKLIRVVDRR